LQEQSESREQALRKERDELLTRANAEKETRTGMQEQMQSLEAVLRTAQRRAEQLEDQAARAREGEDVDLSEGPAGSEGAARGTAAAEELQALRTADAQLRELVAHLRREVALADSRVELAVQRAQAAEAATAVAERRAQQARLDAEAAIEQLEGSSGKTGGTGGLSAQEAADLRRKVDELQMSRESNAVLRAQKDEAAQRAEQAEVRIKQLQDEAEPAADRLRGLEAERVEWEAERASLEKQATRWQERFQGLLARHGEVDKEEYDSVRKEADESKAALEKSAKKLEDLEASLEAARREAKEASSRADEAEETHQRLEQRIAKAR